jgi:hypothetical protein
MTRITSTNPNPNPNIMKTLPPSNDSATMTADFADMFSDKGALRFVRSLRTEMQLDAAGTFPVKKALREFVHSAIGWHRRGERTDLLSEAGQAYL